MEIQQMESAILGPASHKQQRQIQIRSLQETNSNSTNDNNDFSTYHSTENGGV